MPSQIAIHFFLELAVIIAACRVVGLVARRFGQPQVVGEMIAGVLLGPSLLGLVRRRPGTRGDSPESLARISASPQTVAA